MMDIDLSPEQYAARRAIFEWFRAGAAEPFVLFGYAGTGKTTLIKHMIAEAKGSIAVLAPTNKAAKVLRDKGVIQAQTAHSYLYGAPVPGPCECGTQTKNHAKKCPALKMTFARRGFNPETGLVEEVGPPTLIIVDEASMVNEKLAQDIIAEGAPVIAVGDPFQLPPVEGKSGFPEPSFQMEHIQRQALDSPIIRLAHDVRNGRPLRPGQYGDSLITRGSLGRTEFDTDDWDQVLTWRHTSRCRYNDRFRSILGRTDPLPEPGETVMFRSNHKELGIANGDMYTVETVNPQGDNPAVDLWVTDGDGAFGVSTWKLGFGGPEDWKELDTMDFRWKRFHARATFAYTITTHSAQGSEWERVIIAQDGNRNPKWMYTALTRARSRFMLCTGRDD